MIIFTKKSKVSTMSQGYTAFTLSEVLITLGIIGVVAAMTIPTLVNSTEEAQYKTAYKKTYSILNQAFLSAASNGDIVELTGSNSSLGGEANFAAIKKQFAVSKDCPISKLSDCWNTSGELWRSEGSSVPSFIDKSGVEWRLRCPDAYGNAPAILVDTNGSKKPNQYGIDRFPFLFSNGNFVTVSSTDVFGSGYVISDMGMPIKMVFLGDVTVTSANNLAICPSLATHPCYYSSWIMN